MIKSFLSSKFIYLTLSSLIVVATQACATHRAKAPAYASRTIGTNASIQVSDHSSKEESLLASAAPAGVASISVADTTITPTSSMKTRSSKGTNNDKSSKPGTQERASHAKLIYSGTISLQTDEAKIPALIEHIVGEAETFGGHLMARADTTVTIKVPSNHFREAMSKIETFAEVIQRSVSAQDVTEEYLDHEVRLQNLRATRERLQEFLARAKDVHEALAVERELERVAAELDRIQGRLQYLRSHVAFSEIHISVQSKPLEPALRVIPPPPARVIELPIEWLRDIGVNSLLNLLRS